MNIKKAAGIAGLVMSIGLSGAMIHYLPNPVEPEWEQDNIEITVEPQTPDSFYLAPVQEDSLETLTYVIQ